MSIWTVERLDLWFSTCGPLISSNVSHGKFSEMRILGPYSSTTESEALEWGPEILTSLSGDSDACESLSATGLEKGIGPLC